MGICFKCIYKGDPVADNRPNARLRKDNYYCNNEENNHVDYITGEITKGLCRNCNSLGECLLFDNGSTPLYAWSNGTDIYYTLSKTPDVTDSMRDDEMKIQAQITEYGTEIRYAYKSRSIIYYMLTDDPALDDNVLNAAGEVIGKVTTVEENDEGKLIKITVDEIEFTVALASKNNLSVEYIMKDTETKYYRNEEKDFDYFPPEETEETETSDEEETSEDTPEETPEVTE